MVEQEGDGVAQDLPQQPVCQVPKIFCPYALYRIALCELAEDRVDPVAKTAQEGASFGVRIAPFVAVRCHEFYTPLGQSLFSLRRPVVAISNDDATGLLNERRQHGELVGIGRRQREAGDDPRPADPHVHPEAVEGLLEEDVLAESGFSFEARAAVGAGEQTRRQGKRVCQGEGGVVRSLSQEFLPEEFLETFQRLAACLAKVVLCTSPRVGNHSA